MKNLKTWILQTELSTYKYTFGHYPDTKVQHNKI